MAIPTFDALRSHAQPLTEMDAAALRQLQAHPLLSDCAATIGHLLAAGEKLEQEAVQAWDVVDSLEHLRGGSLWTA